MFKNSSIRRVLHSIHEDEDGAMSLETVLIIAVIALPILAVLYTQVWPRIKGYVFDQMDAMDIDSDSVDSGSDF